MEFWAKCSLIIGGVLMLLPRLRGEASEKGQGWGFDEFTAQCDFSKVVNKTMKEARCVYNEYLSLSLLLHEVGIACDKA